MNASLHAIGTDHMSAVSSAQIQEAVRRTDAADGLVTSQ